MQPLFPIPTDLQPAALQAQQRFDVGQYRDAITLCEQALAGLETQIPSRNPKLPRDTEPTSSTFQYYALTVILIDAFAALEEWKPAKETLGKYRVRFPRDPWGFSAGAEVTRRDPAVKDKDAIQRAIELLEGEAQRLEANP